MNILIQNNYSYFFIFFTVNYKKVTENAAK